MRHSTLISANELIALTGLADLLLLDCRFDLSDPQRGVRAYFDAHIPGAQYADLNCDLSDLTQPGLGRHPLPDAAAFAATLSRWGYRAQQQVVVYDDANGGVAARAWWMFRLIGHTAVAVLDGGLPAWTDAGLPLDASVPKPVPTSPQLSLAEDQIVYFDQLAALQQSDRALLLDARAAPRYRGEVEPIDAVAGHIPGALNRPFASNLQADGRFKPRADLVAEFAQIVPARAAADVIHSCGSGVTACHNLLAMEHAGLSGSRVFAPSWSGWISDPMRAVARGEQ